MFFDLLPGPGLICAHRGARSVGPENTLYAAGEAIAAFADFWEFDVRLTADRQPVVFHDETALRTTDAAKRMEMAVHRPFKVHELTLAQLRGLDAGSWFLESDPYGTVASGEVSPLEYGEIRGQRVPALREALEFSRARAFPFNLEIKDMTGLPGEEELVAGVYALLRETGTEELALLSSFNHGYIAQGKRINPAIPWGALVEDRLPGDPAALLQSLGADAYHPDASLTPPEMVKKLVQAGLRVNLWTVNDKDLAKAYVEAGAKALITDWPQRLR